MEVYDLWDRLKAPTQDAELFQATEPKLRELLLGLGDVSKQLAGRTDIFRDVENAQHDFNVAESYGRAGDFGMGTVYESYCAMKLHRVLDTLTRDAKKKLSAKLAYGYDVSGEVQESGGTSGQDNALWDEGNSSKFDKTPPNPVSVAQDFEAEEEFPELAEIKHKRVKWPQRVRSSVTVSPEQIAYAEDCVEQGGGIFIGIQEYDEDYVLALFNSKETGSSLALELPKITSEAVRERIADSDAEFRNS